MHGKSHGSPESPWEGEAQVKEDEVRRDRHHKAHRPETERPHKPARHPDADHHKPRPRHPDSDRRASNVRVSLEDILARNPQADRRRAPRSPKAQLFVTLAHWAMTFLLGLNLVTGMRLGWAYEESPVGGLRGAVSNILATLSPAATLFGINIVMLHVWSAFALLLVAGVYVGYLFRSGTARKLAVTRADMRKLVDGLRSRRFFGNKAALWSANVLVYWLSFLFIAALTVTGLALYRVDLGIASALGGYELHRLLHTVIGYLLIPYTILHATLQWCFGRFWTIFKAQVWRKHVLAGVIGLLIAGPIAVGAFYLDDMTETLAVPRVTSAPAPVLDGNPNDPIWTFVQPVVIANAKATNTPGRITDVTVKAVHDGTNVYFQFQWADPDVSYKRYPLMKTEGGWKVLHTPRAFENADENVYYEDKMSMYITTVRNGTCAATCHLGAGAAAAQGDKHGMHYTTDGTTGDVWHWKSVRTNAMGDLTGEPGFVDDQWFGPLQPVTPGKRYTGGYYADPSKTPGYEYNFAKIDPKKPLSETYVLPKFLPATSRAVVSSDPDASTHEAGKTWWLFKSQVVPYTKEADTYPVGAMLPNIVIEPFTGDQADVRARAEWRDGRWTLETQRRLDTGSTYDVPFVPGTPVYITVATYNRTQTRHGEHIKPVRVLLQP